MYQILEKHALTETIDEMVVIAPEVARKAKPGQFVILRKDEFAERIPLTVADFDREKGAITVIFQKVGRSTRELGELKSGDLIRNFVGPLGKASDVEKLGSVVLVAGGVGIAPVYPIARALHEAGNQVTVILGARSANLLFWEDKMAAVCHKLVICTDDGSKGRKSLVTEPLREILQQGTTARVWAIGPAIMMKFCCQVTRQFGVPTVVSLDSIMVDGTGMCGACRVEVGGETRFVCVDGPEFDGALVNWDVALARKKVFVTEEKEALESWQAAHGDAHVCTLDQALLNQERQPAQKLAGIR
jgi:ferredoxin--NADP+ reductase